MIKGDRVRFKDELDMRGPYEREGTVTGFSKDGLCVYVLWDGRKTKDVPLIEQLEVIP